MGGGVGGAGQTADGAGLGQVVQLLLLLKEFPLRQAKDVLLLGASAGGLAHHTPLGIGPILVRALRTGPFGVGGSAATRDGGRAAAAATGRGVRHGEEEGTTVVSRMSPLPDGTVRFLSVKPPKWNHQGNIKDHRRIRKSNRRGNRGRKRRHENGESQTTWNGKKT